MGWIVDIGPKEQLTWVMGDEAASPGGEKHSLQHSCPASSVTLVAVSQPEGQ